MFPPRKLYAAVVALFAAVVVCPASAQTPSPVQKLYRELHSVGLDPARVYDIRDATLNREDLHLSLDNGTIAFTRAVDGRITGAFFTGDGEILLLPPTRTERIALGLFTGTAILEEKFSSAYLRFNDDVFTELKPALRETDEDKAEFITRWNPSAELLAEGDALRLLGSFLSAPNSAQRFGDHLLRARLAGTRLGAVDVYFDTLLPEQISIRNLSYKDGLGYYDVWLSFAMRNVRQASETQDLSSLWNDLHINRYSIKARVQPPTDLEADTTVDLEALQPGSRVLLFELSRFLKLREVTADGAPVEFLQNEAVEGSALARRGNDVVAVVLPQPLAAGRKLQLRFVYGGAVLSEAGGGLMYVGARGAWYPHRGPAMAEFALEFRYPQNWTLVATGKRVSLGADGEEVVSRWRSERPIPVAGFNLGQYVSAAAKSGDVLVESYTSQAMENNFPKPPAIVLHPTSPPTPEVSRPAPSTRALDVMVPPVPNPAGYSEVVAQNSAKAIDFFSRSFGPFPYSSLSLAQMPGTSSQGWPGLIFLSSFAYLTPEQRRQARLSDVDSLIFGHLMQAHETAHQWWGDLVMWKSYRDQWIVEALANYSALLLLEKDHPELAHQILEDYRTGLMLKDRQGNIVSDAGPVTLGLRLSSSKFPNGFEAISYGRGTWLFHMLRNLLRDPRAERRGAADDAVFLQALRSLVTNFAGKEISTADLQRAFEAVLPDSVRFEGRKSLDWFFDGWVNGNAVPKLALNDVKFSRRGAATVATGKLLQEDAPRDLITSVPIYAGFTGKAPVFVARLFADGNETAFRLTVPVGTRKLLVDPYGTVLTRP